MRIILLLLIFITLPAKSQCNTHDLFPFTLGMDKFTIMQTISDNPHIIRPVNYPGLYDALDESNNGWRSYKYLKEKVYLSIINLENRKINPMCLGVEDNRMQLYLVDDVMYKYYIYYEYNKEDFGRMKQDYDSLINLHNEIYPYNKNFTISNINTKERVGEGVKFYEEDENDQNTDKAKYLKISYNIRYKPNTNNVLGYEIEIFKVDLNGTKLKTQEF